MIPIVSEIASGVILATLIAKAASAYVSPSDYSKGRHIVEEVINIYKRDGKQFQEKDRKQIAALIHKLQRQAQQLERKDNLARRLVLISHFHRRQFESACSELHRNVMSLSQQLHAVQILDEFVVPDAPLNTEEPLHGSSNGLLYIAPVTNVEAIESMLNEEDVTSQRDDHPAGSDDILYGDHIRWDGDDVIHSGTQPLATLSHTLVND